MASPEEEMMPDVFGVERLFASDGPAVGKAEEDELAGFKDPYLSPAGPNEPLLRAFGAPLDVGCTSKVNVQLLVDGSEGDALGELPSLPEPEPLQAYNVHFLSSLLAPHGSPAVVPLGAWARDGAVHPGIRVIPVELKEGGGTVTSEGPVGAALQSALSQESHGFPPPQQVEDTNPRVLCQLKGATQMLCVDGAGTGEAEALHLVPQYQDQTTCLPSEVPKPVATLLGRFLPVPAKLNLVAQLDDGALPSVVNRSALPSGSALLGPPKITLAGYCDCFASGDFCTNCNCSNFCNNLHNGMERFKAIKACLDRNAEASQNGRVGDVRPRHSRGCDCTRLGCLKSCCDGSEARIMCSSICKCIGCKNYDESPEQRTRVAMPNYMEGRGSEGSRQLSGLPTPRKARRSSCISWEVVEATCACLLAQGEEAERQSSSECLAEQMILEEFGRCLSQILHTGFKSKGLNTD